MRASVVVSRRTWSELRLPLLAPTVFLLPLICYLVPLVWVRLEPDEAVYGVIARGILNGQVPYRDIFDHKPPLIYAWYILSFLVFGQNEHAPRVLGALALCGTAGSLFVVARAMFSERRAYVLAAVFGVSTGAVLAGFDANTEVFALLPATASLAILIDRQRRQRIWPVFTAGVLAAVAIWTHPTMLPAGAALGVWLVVEGARRRQPRPVLGYLAGGLVTIPLVVAPFLITRSLGDFVYAVIEYQGAYFDEYSGYRWVFLVAYVPRAAVAVVPVAAAGYFGLSNSLRRRKWNGPSLMFFAWAGGILVGQFLTGRYYPHYVAQMLPVFVLAAGFLPESPKWRWSFRSPLALTLAFAIVASAEGNLNAFREVTASNYQDQQGAALGREIAASTCPDQQIWEFGRWTTPYFYANRYAPTRFIYDRPFWVAPATLDEAIAAVRARPPVLIIDTMQNNTDALPQHRIDTSFNGRFYPAGLADLLSQSYVVEPVSHGATLYRLRGGGPGCG